MKSRMKHFSVPRRHVDGNVDGAALGVGVDDAAKRWYVGVVAAETDYHIALVDHLIVGRVESQPLILRCPHRGPGVRGVDATMRSLPGGGSVARYPDT